MRDPSRSQVANLVTALGVLARAAALAVALLAAHTVAAQPRPFREYPGFEGADAAATGGKATRVGPTTIRRPTAYWCRC